MPKPGLVGSNRHETRETSVLCVHPHPKPSAAGHKTSVLARSASVGQY